MEPWVLAVVLKPFAALVLFGLIALPCRLLVQRYMRDGKLKRLLLTPLDRKQAARYRQAQADKPLLKSE